MKPFCIYLVSLLFYFESEAQLERVVVESTPIYQIVDGVNFMDYTSYRIFAQLDQSDASISSVSNIEDCDLSISSTTSFYRYPYISSVTGSGINSFLVSLLPVLGFSSFVSIGESSSGFLGIPREEDGLGGLFDGNISYSNSNQTIAIDPEVTMAEFLNEGGNIMFNQLNGGAWLSASGFENSMGLGINNSVLLGQFTTDGDFSYELNISTLLDGETTEHTHCDSNIQGLTFYSYNCTSIEACNYNSSAQEDDGSCFFPGEPCSDGNTNTLNDMFTADCECAGELIGCTNEEACNFNTLAVISDESCDFPGDNCNDGTFNTINDRYNEDCSCSGDIVGCTSPTACNYNPEAVVDGACIVINSPCSDDNPNTINDSYNYLCECVGVVQGCLFSAACNYNPWAVISDGSCLYEGSSCSDGNASTSNDTVNILCNCVGTPSGCMDILACNFDSNAIIDNGSCLTVGDSCESSGIIGSSCACIHPLSGYTFIDDNFNGLPDDAVYIPFQTVTLQPLGTQIITDDSGFFNFGLLEPGEYTVSVEYSYPWTENTTPQSYVINAPLFSESLVYFGVSNNEVPDPTGCVDFYQWGAGVPCNDQLGYNICYRNMSPYPINGFIEIELDPLLSYNNSYPPAENIDGQVISWSFEGLGSSQMNFDDIIVDTPSEEHIGEFMTSTAKMYAEVDGETFLLFEKVITQEVTCAYDPNDITGIPEGYTEDHLVLPDTRMEYLIRFQNTGNAPAGTVMVVDSLDEDMDASTFQLIANSHSVMTTIDENGRVEFLFEDINLPDSIADEPGSHGMISFKIDFKEDIEIGEEVNQTAYIFFDNNPPVITNTTWHTMHECGGESDFELSSTFICAGEEITMTGTNALVEEHQWNIESALASTVDEFTQTFDEEGDYIIQLVAENPLCTESSMQMLTVYDLPEAELIEDGALLTAGEGFEYQWYLNDEPITGAVDQTHEAVEDGIYTVEVINENGCLDVSEALMVVSIEEFAVAEFEIYPNPMSDVAFIEFISNSRKTIKLLDASGKEVRVWENITNQRVEISRGSLAKGTYFVSVLEGDVITNKAIIIK